MTGDDANGHLTMVATPIGNLGDLSPRAVQVLGSADVIAAEDTRRVRKLLSHASVSAGGRVRSVRAENEHAAARGLVAEMQRGAHVAYVTDAGMPTISDPGAHLVRVCIDAGVPVGCVPGPSAGLMALALSGLETGRFAFEGFLPRKGRERRARLEAIAQEDRTVVLHESPRRLVTTLADLGATCGPDRRVAIARELTKAFEEVWRGTLGEASERHDRPARGEVVVVLEGASPESITDAEVVAAVDRALAGGASPREAAMGAARELGVGKNRAYETAISRSRASDRRTRRTRA